MAEDKNRKGLLLNIGCGLDAPSGWMNIDVSPSLRVSKIPLVGSFVVAKTKGLRWPARVGYGNIARGIGLPPGSCRLVFASHVLEHLSLHDSSVALRHIHGYLEEGGIFRCILPDLECLARRYLSDLQREDSRVRAAPDFIEATYLGVKAPRDAWLRRLPDLFLNSRHSWMWDVPSFSAYLSRHGFVEVRSCRYGEWADARFKEVEREERHRDGFCLEARKGCRAQRL